MSASTSTTRTGTVATAEPALVASVVQDTGGHMPSIEAHPIVALEENIEQQPQPQIIGSLSPLKPRPTVAAFSSQTKSTEVVTAVPEPLTSPVPVSVTPAQEAASKPAPVAANKPKSAANGGDGDDPVGHNRGDDVKATAIAITAGSQNKMQTPAPGSLTLPAMLYINNATPVADTAADCAAESMPLIKAENVDLETKQQSQLNPQQPRAEESTALATTTPTAESSTPKLASSGDSVDSAELLPAVAVEVTGDVPTSTVLQASISPTPTLRVSAESTDKDASMTPVTPAAIAVADVADEGDSKQVSSTPAKPCTTTVTTSAVWSTPTTAPPVTFASSESTTAIGAAVAAAEAGAAVQREQQAYAELRADALNTADTQSATRADARTPLSLGNFETKLQLDPMSLFSGLSGMGSSALFASQALTSAALHPANVNVTEAQLLANQLRAAGSEPAPKPNGLFPALGGMSPEDYSRSVDLLRNLAAQQHLALLSSGAGPNGASLRDAEAVRQAHNNAILFPTNTSSSNANPFRASTGPPVNSCEATIAKPETAILTQPSALRSSSTKPSTSSLDATSAAAKTSVEGTTASVVTAADPTTTRGTTTATATTNATMATTATVGSAVNADPVAGTPVTEASTATPQYTPGRTLTRDELFLAVQAKQFALLRASLLANAANATNGTNSPISAAARSLSARTFGSAQQDSSVPKVIGTDSTGPNPSVPLSEVANIDATSESVTNMLASAMKLLNNDPAALLDFSKATTKERAMLLRTINMQINRTNQLPGKMQQNRRLPATLQSIQSMLPNGAHNRFSLMGRNQLPFGDYNVLFERAQGRAYAATGGATPQRQHSIFGERATGHPGTDPLSLHMVHNNAAAVAAGMHMASPANTTFSRHVAAGLGMKPVIYGSAGNQPAVSVPGAMRAATITQQQQQHGVVPSASSEAKSVKDAKRRAKRPRPQPQSNSTATLETQKKAKKDPEGEEEDEDESPVGWVQCNRCEEWRQLPRNIDADSLPEEWFCKDATWKNDFKCKKVSRRTPKKQTAKLPKSPRSARTSSGASSSANRRTQNGARTAVAGGGTKISGDDRQTKAREANARQSVKQGKSRTSRSKGSRSSKKENDTIIWVQCEKCSKWRQVPGHIKLETEKWFCSMNTWDPNLSCEVPEEVDVDEEETTATVETPKPSRSRSSNSSSQSARSRRTPSRGCRGNSTPATASTPSNATHATPRSSRRSNKVENFEWVECVICRTWRKLPKHVKTASLPDKWDCSMNKWDPKRNSCTAPQEKSEGAASAKGLHNSGGTERKKSSLLPSYRELIQAHYRTGGHHRSTTNVKSGFGQGMRKFMQDHSLYCSSKSRKRQNTAAERREKKRARNCTNWWRGLSEILDENGHTFAHTESCRRMASANSIQRAHEKLRHCLFAFLSKARTPLTLQQILDSVGEPAPLLRDVILEQLHDLKEEEFVNSTAPQQDNDSAGANDKDATKGLNSSGSTEAKEERWYIVVNERKAKVKRPRMQLNFLRHSQQVPATMPMFVALPAKLAKPWKIHDDCE